jgi:hypothetical protein
MGPYHGGFGRSWALYGTLLPVVLAPPFILVMARRLHGPGKALAAKLLAEPAPFGNLLVVTRDEAIAPQGSTAHGKPRDGNAREGRRYATAGEAAAPAAYQPVALPGRSGQQVPVSVFEQAAGLGRERSSFWEARGPDGRPMFVVESRSGGSSEPESILIDTGGTARVIIRRISAHPMSFTLLHPNGALLGSILPVKGTNWGAFEVKDQQGNTWARIAARHRTWVARVEPAAPPPFPYVALAFTFDQLRRPPR